MGKNLKTLTENSKIPIRIFKNSRKTPRYQEKSFEINLFKQWKVRTSFGNIQTIIALRSQLDFVAITATHPWQNFTTASALESIDQYENYIREVTFCIVTYRRLVEYGCNFCALDLQHRQNWKKKQTREGYCQNIEIYFCKTVLCMYK